MQRVFVVCLGISLGFMGPAYAQPTPPSPAPAAKTTSGKPTATRPMPASTSARSTNARSASAKASGASARANPTSAKAQAASAPRRLQDIHIEGEIPVPQVLFVTARDQRRFLDFNHRRYLKTSRELGETTPFPSSVCVTRNQSIDAGKETSR